MYLGLNVFLIFIPISWAMRFTEQSKTIIFISSFLAIIPLVKLLGFATEELSLQVDRKFGRTSGRTSGQTINGLLEATLVGASFLIIALVKCELSIVHSSLIGSILSNILLVLGVCFFAGGTKYSEQGFLTSASNISSSLLTVSVAAVLIPATYLLAIDSRNASNPDDASVDLSGNILKMSRGVAVVLLFIYGSYLVFQFWTHLHLYNDGAPEQKFASTPYPAEEDNGARANGPADDPETGAGHGEERPEVKKPQMSMTACLLVLASVTTFKAFGVLCLVESIDGVVSTGWISKQWVGLILLPMVGNVPECLTAVAISYQNRLTQCLGVAVGSSIQIALFVIPFIVILAWILGKPLTLLFDPLQSIVLFLSVITVNYCLHDGKSNWLEVSILHSGLYIIIAVSFWFYPDSDNSGTCN
ncbi:calcium/proton exchanger [Hysterangium stoloniferum]|nr:calcium/proton exchanger [Hysterangium stoloniferum]